MLSTTSVIALGVLAGCLAFTFYRRATRFSIKHIRGPPSGSFWTGNTSQFSHQKNVGDLDFKYVKEFGKVWRLGGPLGHDVLMICDPKALQHVFHKSGYNYPKTIEAAVITKMIAGDSILWAPSAHSHSRHRKVMNPAFSAPQLRSFLPLFRRGADHLCRKWKEEVLGLSDPSSEKAKPDGEVIAVNKWLARTTLDVIGETAFHYDFGALDNSNNAVTDAYHNLFADSGLNPPLWNILFRACWRYLPNWVLDFVQYVPTREYKRFRQTLKVINGVSETLVDSAVSEARNLSVADAQDGKVKAKKDVMSVLVRANMSENPSTQLSKTEMISEMAALTLAGHETTANALTWMLWELAKHPEFQEKLRDEIRAKREDISMQSSGADGNDQSVPDFTIDDLESMPFLQALLKEILRFHPIVYHLVRSAGKDDVIPLSEPIITATGESISEIPVAKGQGLMISICAYNRLESVWGPDAAEFNPMRFMEDSEEGDTLDSSVKVGMYANLMSFSAGLRGCIGWRFSVIEMQAILVALVENFEFSLPDDKPEVLRMAVGLMSPMVMNRFQEGVLMPLRVKAIDASR